MTTNEIRKLRSYLEDESMTSICNIIKECILEITRRLQKDHAFPRSIYVHGRINDGYSYPDILLIGNEHNFNDDVESAHTYRL